MHVGFLSNQLDNRGTGNALYNYAHYNEEILGNKSSIYTFARGRHDAAAYVNFENRFGRVSDVTEGFAKLDALYHIKSGVKDGFSPGLPYLVHSVFDNEPHGTIYATISPWMGERYNLPFVPHIVEIFQTDDDLRNELGIPVTSMVFGRYGGLDSFDIPFVWDAINELLESRTDVYFLFMNTAAPSKIFDVKRVIFLQATVDPREKRRFINSSNAFLHARGRGETFGLAVAEFAVAGKPIITYAHSNERAHLQELGQQAYLYADKDSLKAVLNSLINKPTVSWGYQQYTPENVMQKFEQVFLTK